MNRKPNLAVVGATGVVGTTFLKVLEERNFPFENLYIMASAKSAGKTIEFRGKEYIVEELNEHSFDKDIDIALFSAGGAVSEKYAPIAAEHGVVVVDNSSQWRMDPDVPLVVPEVNPEAIGMNNGIIANPNCSTIQAMLPLKVLHDKYTIKRIVYSTYQAVSGAGIGGIYELEDQEKAIVEGGEITTETFPYQIARNLIPQIGGFGDNLYTSEEMKMQNEGRKIMHLPELNVTCTCVRVPVMRSHSISVSVETERKISVEEARAAIAAAPGCKLVDELNADQYPMPLVTSNQDIVHVGRIRDDLVFDNGLALWCAGDQIRKGAATNTVQIAELLL
jgi:aspartate-semialdehyde dehydrogenase